MQFLHSSKKLPVEFWGTDMNTEVLERARAGIYSPSSLRNLPSMALRDYFLSTPQGFLLSEDVKKGIHWVQHDFISENPPGMNFNIIFLRNNLLTYYDQPIRIGAFSQIQAALNDGGFLIIGNNERLPAEGFTLKPRQENRCIFEKFACE